MYKKLTILFCCIILLQGCATFKSFFGKNILDELANLDNLKFVKLEKQFDMPRQRVDYAEQLMKKLKIFFMQSIITNSLEKKFNTSLITRLVSRGELRATGFCSSK